METAIHSEHYNGLSLNLHNGVFSDYSLGGHSIPTRDLDDRSNDQQQQQQQQQQQSSSQSQQQRQQQQQQQERHQENGTPQRVQKRNSSDSAGNGNGGSGTSGGGGGSGGGSGGGGQAKRPGRKCGTHLRFADIDARMLQWMLEMNAYKVPLSDSTIQAKAKQLAQVLGTNDFKASNGWLYKFKERHGFVMSSKAAQSSMGVGAPAPTHPLSTHSHSAPPSMTASQHSPPGPPMVPPNACLPSEYPPPVSIAAVVPHPGMQQRGGPGLASAMPSHQQLSSLGPSPVHLSGHMAPPPPPPHTPRDLVTPPPLGQSQQIPSLGPSPFLPPPPQHISPPPAVQTPGKPSPDYELARYHQTLNDYDPSRIYTVSETCLLYNKLPRDTLTDTLNPESRLTILLCANADGTHKLRPLVINSRRDGEDFNENRDKLPVSYETQRSSYMTGKIFQQWIWELERRVEYPCVLLLDASPAHVSVQSDKITLLKLHNSLRQLQPLNQGAMTEFKARYKAEMISRIEQNYKQIGQGNNCSGGNSNGAWILTPPEAMLSFVDALYILNQAWKSLSRESLLESWTRSQLLPFRMYNGRKDIEEEAIQELSQVIKSSKICCGEFISNAQGAGSPVGTSELGRKEIAEYLHLDDTIETSYSFSEEAFESSRAPQGYTSEAMDTALMQYYHLQRSRQQTPEEILAMLDTMERFFTHQALISSTDILAIHSLRTKTYQIASNYFPPTSSMLSSASSLGASPPVVSPPMSSATPHAHLSPHSQYTPPLLAGPSLVPTVHQQPPYPVSY